MTKNSWLTFTLRGFFCLVACERCQWLNQGSVDRIITMLYSRLRSIGENWRMLTNGPIGFRFPGGNWFSNKIGILLTGAVEAKATVRLNYQSFPTNGLRTVLHFKVELEGPPTHKCLGLSMMTTGSFGSLWNCGHTKARRFFPETAFGGVWRDREGSCENSSGQKPDFTLPGVPRRGIRRIISSRSLILVHYGKEFVHFLETKPAPARKILTFSSPTLPRQGQIQNFSPPGCSLPHTSLPRQGLGHTVS